jgi:hypothetical protein
MPPIGRAAKPTAYVPSASSVPTSGSDSGKNNCPKTSAAAVPYRKKSYHSMVVPMKLAAATFLTDCVCSTVPRLPQVCREAYPSERATEPGE